MNLHTICLKTLFSPGRGHIVFWRKVVPLRFYGAFINVSVKLGSEVLFACIYTTLFCWTIRVHTYLELFILKCNPFYYTSSAGEVQYSVLYRRHTITLYPTPHCLTLSMLWANSANGKLTVCLFYQTTGFAFHANCLQSGFDISCKLSPLERICMKSQILFKWDWHFMQIVSIGENLHEKPNLV